jgi:CubicO group peptidase (beta-lactamase class C family)
MGLRRNPNGDSIMQIGAQLALTAGLACWAVHADAAVPTDLDTYVQHAMTAFGSPGLGLAIVENGQVSVARGYGVRKLNTGEMVDAHTAFPIGSETKAFTVAALAILVDRKKLSWDDRVVDRLPGFQMYDPYATAHMTVRDLLTHRSGLGLGEGDLLVILGSDRSRADIVHALRYLKPVTGFREKFAYDNILYIVAGALVEAISGQSWESFVGANIFQPLGMKDSHANFMPGAANEVSLHARTDGAFRGVGNQAVLEQPAGFDVVGPAGTINASPADMATWMNLQLARGRMSDGSQLFSAEQADEMWKPVVVVPAEEFKLPPRLAGMQPDLQTYAMGWFVECYRGHMIVQHSGAVFGGLAMQFLIPERHVGISVTINSEDSFTRRAVAYHLLDYYLGLAPTDWISSLQDAHTDMIAGAMKALKDTPAPTAHDATPTLPLAAYAGKYIDPWYGSMTISEAVPGRLSIRFDRTPGMQGALQPDGGNRFRTSWTDHNIENAFIDFHADGDHPTGATLSAISPLADFSFDYQDLHFVGPEIVRH